MRHMISVLGGCLLLASSGASAQQPGREHLQAVRDFVAAFNAHDSGAMAGFVTEDVQWISLDGDAISVEADGKAALISAMNDYFQSCPTCRSRLSEMAASRDRVSAVEVASWQDPGGARTQAAMAVYEFSGMRIKRVYYFPAEK